MIDVSLSPVSWKCAGTDRSISSGAGLFAPNDANLLASSLPFVPLCPLTHLKHVGAHLLRR